MNLWEIAESCAAQSLAVMAVAWGATCLMKGSSAAARHLVWVAAFGLLLVLPAIQSLRPKEFGLTVHETVMPTPVATTERSSQVALRPAQSSPVDIRLAVATVWGVGAGFLLLQLGLDALRLGMLRRRSEKLSGLHGIGKVTGVRLVVALGEQPRVPITWGTIQPVVMLPRLSNNWPKDRMSAVVLHELAHVRRYDFLASLTARFACAVFWFNPLAWFGLTRLRAEAENAADDFVLAAGVAPSDYASHLVQIVREIASVRGRSERYGLAAIGSAPIVRRVRSILTPGKCRRTATGQEYGLVFAAAAIIVFALPSIAPSPRQAAPRPAVRSAVKVQPKAVVVPRPVEPAIVVPKEAPTEEPPSNPSPSPEPETAPAQTPTDGGQTDEPSVPVQAPPAPEPAVNEPAVNESALVSLDVDRADIRSALQVLFQSTGFSYSVDPNVQGEITASLHQVPFEMALRLICANTGATYSVQAGVYQIKPAARQNYHH